MAMTFTLVAHLREQIGVLIRSKIELQRKTDAEKELRAIEVSHQLANYRAHSEYIVKILGRRETYSWDPSNSGILHGMENQI